MPLGLSWHRPHSLIPREAGNTPGCLPRYFLHLAEEGSLLQGGGKPSGVTQLLFAGCPGAPQGGTALPFSPAASVPAGCSISRSASSSSTSAGSEGEAAWCTGESCCAPLPPHPSSQKVSLGLNIPGEGEEGEEEAQSSREGHGKEGRWERGIFTFGSAGMGGPCTAHLSSQGVGQGG